MRIDQLDSLSSLLGLDNVESMKAKICDIIVSKIQSDIDDYDKYIFYPPDFEGFFEDCFENVKKKAKKEIEAKLYEKVKDVQIQLVSFKKEEDEENERNT